MQSFNDPFLIQQDEDLDRTVGINTGHVGTSDFTLEEEDRSFAVAVSVDFSIIKQNKTSVLCSKKKNENLFSSETKQIYRLKLFYTNYLTYKL